MTRIRAILVRCWALQPAERPSMAEVVEMLSPLCNTLSSYCLS
jgi:hypothetical protein